jgi:hypothetical protein
MNCVCVEHLGVKTKTVWTDNISCSVTFGPIIRGHLYRLQIVQKKFFRICQNLLLKKLANFDRRQLLSSGNILASRHKYWLH